MFWGLLRLKKKLEIFCLDKSCWGDCTSLVDAFVEHLMSERSITEQQVSSGAVILYNRQSKQYKYLITLCVQLLRVSCCHCPRCPLFQHVWLVSDLRGKKYKGRSNGDDTDDRVNKLQSASRADICNLFFHLTYPFNHLTVLSGHLGRGSVLNVFKPWWVRG